MANQATGETEIMGAREATTVPVRKKPGPRSRPPSPRGGRSRSTATARMRRRGSHSLACPRAPAGQ